MDFKVPREVSQACRWSLRKRKATKEELRGTSGDKVFIPNVIANNLQHLQKNGI